MTKRGYIDRFEGDLAVIEVDGSTIDVLRDRLPAGARPGDAVVIEGDKIRLDPDRKAAREKEIQDLMNDLWED